MHKFFFAFCLVFIWIGNCWAQGNSELTRKAETLHHKIVTVDTHTDTPMRFMANPSIDLGKDNSNTQVDFIKMQQGGLDAAFYAVFLEQGARDEAGYIIAENMATSIFKSIYERVNKYPEKVQIATSPVQAYQLKRQGKRAIFIGIENGWCIGKDLNNIARFKKMGASYITLCHVLNNDICDSSTDRAEYDGLSDFGVKVVKEMNRLGVMVDVSHTSDNTVRDVIRYSKAPVIASHSCVRALANHRRNLNDDLIKLIARTGGVVQVNLVSHFLRSPALGKASVGDVVNHIDHIVKLVGVDHVGIGSDFDGGARVIGCNNSSEIKNITVELMHRGYTDAEIAKIWGGNLLRVMTDVQKLSE